jgi:catechol 2,3-dioxygenase-like lactoylglutathione lyase family enzyme
MAEPQRSLATVALVVRDYDEAKAWFVDMLDFVVVEDTDLGDGKRWLVVAPRGQNGARLLLAAAANEAQKARIGDQTGGRVFLFLETDDFERAYAVFRKRGVRFTETPRSERYGKVAVFLDLYGNRWDLLQPK